MVREQAATFRIGRQVIRTYRDAVLRYAMWTVRQRRYRALVVLMLGVAVGCAVAGTWQVSRYQQSVRDNDALLRNAHAAATPLTTDLVAVVGLGPAPAGDAVRFRTVTVTGRYLDLAPEFVGNQTVNGVDGYDVLAHLQTSQGVLLVIRGFVAGSTTSGAPPPTIPAVPPGVVSLVGRLENESNSADQAGRLPNGEIASINAVEQSHRLGQPVYQAYLELRSAQPGTSGLTALPGPDLSNPAGGAYEWQHLAYVVQWYVFGLLALAAPFAMGRRDVREAQRRYLGTDTRVRELGGEAAGSEQPGQSLTSAQNAVAVHGSSTVVLSDSPTVALRRRAQRLADRYGTSLGPGDGDEPLVSALGQVEQSPRPIRNSRQTPHRSEGDQFHASYNDYLWQLALADGATPSVEPDDGGDTPGPH